MAGVWEHHDKDRFEVFAFDNGRNDGSRTRQRIEAAMDKIVPISHLGNSQAAAAIFENEIDILVNLNGYFGGERSLIFAERPAPIQVNYLGFPGTLGADYFDYLVADDVVIPESERKFYSEKIVTLPGSYQANDRTKAIAGDMTRAECGLPENGFIFCCFNNNYKILPSIFEIWMRLLAHCENSVLWLLNDNDVAVRNLRQEAHLRGIRPERLIFADRMPLSLHLARHRLADLFLDTLPYNAHTTASDALWAGLPLVTCRGTTFPGRVAASLLTAMDLPELIADNLRDYEKLATGLAHNPVRLHAIRNKLQANRLAKPLFDTQGFTRNLETAYQAMNNRFLSGDSPDHIVVPDVGTYVGTSKGWPF